MGVRRTIDSAAAAVTLAKARNQRTGRRGLGGAYEADAVELARTWEQVAFEQVHAAALAFLPAAPGVVLDLGAGSGRDAAWFAQRGWSVVAVEPSAGLREVAGTLHPTPAVRWENDRLPGLERTLRLGLSFDLVWLSAVWMHVAPPDRRRAFRKLVTLLKPGGRMMLSLRHGPAPPDRPMHPVDAAEVETLAVEHGLAIRQVSRSEDRLGRTDVSWTTLVLEMPDDATGALPLLRGIILEDAKSATYKLALVRVLARIADQSAAMTRHAGDHVEVPLGLVALYWLRMFKPLLAADIPQAPSNRVGKGLGFVKEAYAAIADIPAMELRPGASFAPDRGAWLVRALGDAAATIATMPAFYLTFADGGPIFPTVYRGRPRHPPGSRLVIEPAMLWAFGTTRVPLHLWIALRRLAAWIEPMLLAEWSRLSIRFAAAQGRTIGHDPVLRALRWISPERDTATVRKIAQGVLARGRPIHCVWSGRRLSDVSAIEIDHCFPFSAWPCDDLWNLLPASRQANAVKRDRLVTDSVLSRAEDRIQSWWSTAYRDSGDAQLARQFTEEAQASLPVDLRSGQCSDLGFGLQDGEASPIWAGEVEPAADLASVFAAMRYQRLRLRQDQNLPEWEGVLLKAGTTERR